MKLKSKLILAISSLSIVALPTILLASCSTPSSGNNNTPPDTSTPEEPKPQPPVLNPTTSKNNVSKQEFSFQGTVQDNAYTINKQWIFDNKDKLLNGTSLFTKPSDISVLNVFPNKDDNTKMRLEFSLISGKWVDNNNNAGTQDQQFIVDLDNFDTPTINLDTLTHLLRNYISPFLQPKKYELAPNKAINKVLQYNGSTIVDWLKLKTSVSTWDTKGEKSFNGQKLNPVIFATKNYAADSTIDDSLIFSRKDFQETVIEFFNIQLKKFGYIDENHNVDSVNLYWEYIEVTETTFNNTISNFILKPSHLGFNVKNQNGNYVYKINNDINIAPIGGMPTNLNYIPFSFTPKDSDISNIKLIKTSSGTSGEEIDIPAAL